MRIPVYERKSFYQAPSVTSESTAPRRLREAYQTKAEKIAPAVGKVLNTLSEIKTKNSQPILSIKKVAEQNSPSAKDGGETIEQRKELLDFVRQKTRENGSVQQEDLTSFAISHFGNVEQKESLARDFSVLYHVAEEEKKNRHKSEKMRQAFEQVDHAYEISGLIGSPSALGAYLDKEQELYSRHLQEAGISEEEAQNAARDFRQEAIARNIRTALSNKNWNEAVGILAAHKDSLSPKRRQEAEAQARFGFAVGKGEYLWQISQREKTLHTEEELQTWVQKKLEKDDPDTRRTALGVFNKALEAQRVERLKKQSEFFKKLTDENEDVFSLIYHQTDLSEEKTARVQRGILKEKNGPSESDPTVFNRLFAEGRQAELFTAFDKGQLCARDYFLLEAQRSEREAGGENRQNYLLGLNIKKWCQKNGFSEDETTRLAYQVFSSSADSRQRLNIWADIKKQLKD